MNPLPWIIGLGVTALVALGKPKGAKAEPVTPKPAPKPSPKPAKSQPITTMPVGPGVPVQVKPVPRTTLPPMVPPDAVEIDIDDIDETSAGLPVQPKPVAPKPVKPPPVEEIIDAIDELPIDPGVIEQPISIDEPIARPPVDLGELEEIVLDVPPEESEPEWLDPSDLAVEVYNITQGGVRNLKGSEVRTIKAYQGEVGLKQDGLYGPDTAETLIQFGFVPSKPWIWPSSGRAAAKRDWKELMQQWAATDPQREEEWLAQS